jgi:hypothetical protein
MGGVVRRLDVERLEERMVLSGGMVLTPGISGHAGIADDQGIWVAGASAGGDFALQKYDFNGHLDATFGTNGTIKTNGRDRRTWTRQPTKSESDSDLPHCIERHHVRTGGSQQMMGHTPSETLNR